MSINIQGNAQIPLIIVITAFVTATLVWIVLRVLRNEVRDWPIVFFVGFVLALIVGFLEFFVPFNSIIRITGEEVPHYVLPMFLGVLGLAIFFFSIFVELWMALKNGSRRTAEEIAALRKSNQNTFQYMGNADQLLEDHLPELMEAAKASYEVKNTLVFFSTINGPSIDAGRYIQSNAGKEDRRFSIIKEVVKRRRIWRDIYSEKDVERIAQRIDKFSEVYRNEYFPKILIGTYPVVNMVLFKRRPRDEVWFGFGLFDDYNGPVFRTENPRICEYFNNYFAILNADSREWGKIGRRDILGIWLSTSHEKGKIRDIAVISMSLDGRVVDIRGDVFKLEEDKFIYLRSFKSDYSTFYFEDSVPCLVFTFVNLKGGLPENRGGGIYRFATIKTVNRFNGYVFSQDGHTRQIYGARVPGKYEGQIELENYAKTAAILENMVNEGSVIAPPQGEDGNPYRAPGFA